MKKLLFILFVFYSCCPEEQLPIQEVKKPCYKIMGIGKDNYSSYIIVQKSVYNLEKYKVADWMDWKNKYEICDLTGLEKLPL